MTSSHRTPRRRTGAAIALTFAAATLGLAGCSGTATAPPAHAGGGEANLSLPETLRDGSVTILGMNGLWPLYVGLVLCIFGLLFGVWTYSKLRALPAHESMKEISELIYTTCKAYLVKQGKFLMLLWVFIAAVIVVYFAMSGIAAWQIGVILLFSLVGMAGSFGVAWFGIRINTFANSRTSHAALKGEKWGVHDIPARSGMSVGMVLISLELLLMRTRTSPPHGEGAPCEGVWSRYARSHVVRAIQQPIFPRYHHRLPPAGIRWRLH